MTTNKTELFSKVVEPICDIEEGKKKGNYTWIYDWITPDHIPLEKVSGKKKVYLVPLTETVEGTEGISAFLKKKGLKLCVNAPQYFLGLMAKMKLEDQENYSWVVAAENEASSVFADEGGDRCFLYADREGGRRGLSLVRLDGYCFADRGWVFLAEDLDDSETLRDASESVELSNLDTLSLAIEEVKKAGYRIFKEI